MTRKEFEFFRLSVEQETFPRNISDPIEFGIQRTLFRKQKLKKLIAAGKGVSSKTVQAKVDRWRRQLGRLERSQAQMTRLKKELSASRLVIYRPARA